MAKKDTIGNKQDKIKSDVQDISTPSGFRSTYQSNTCFRSKVNSLYNDQLAGNKKLDDITKTYNKAANRVRKEKLVEAQTLLDQCLQDQNAQDEYNNIGSKASRRSISADTDFTSSPFDRRLERLYISSKAWPRSTTIRAEVINPFDINYQDAGTIGFIISERKIRESQVQNQEEIVKRQSELKKEMQTDPFYLGVPALINTYALTKLYGSEGGDYLVNRKNQRKWYEIDTTQNAQLGYSLNPTTTSVINWGEGDPYGRTPYHFSDFVFCKYWNIVPNNRMITLRRFPAPILDNMKFPGMDGINQEDTLSGSGKKVTFVPMATAITYFGEETGNSLGSILKFTTGFKWGDVQANVWEVDSTSNPEMDQGPGGMFGSLLGMAKMLNIATGNFDMQAIMNKGYLPPDPYTNGPYENRVIGPVNRIDTVKKRDAGLEYENNISIIFEYVARPIGGVNTKAAILDIISNFLIIGSATAMFWGGQHRFMGQPQRYPFIGGDEGIQRWYRGDPIGWGKTAIEDFSSKFNAGDFFEFAKSFFTTLIGGDKGSGGNWMGGIQNIISGDNPAANIIKATVAEKSQGQIPYLTGLKALLIGEPVGEWHVTIGNPLNPIAMIGNLICKNIEVEFGDELGPDDFPLEVKITVNLEHGMPRDKDAIQSIFNRGMGRIYDLPDGFLGTADYETHVDKYTGNKSKTGTSPAGWRSVAPLATSATTGGKTGKAQIIENVMHGSVSVWNRSNYEAVAATQNLNFTNPNSLMVRSEFRAVDWVILKSLK